MKVTQVEPQKRTLRLRSGQVPRRFNIFLDGKFAFGADEDLVVNRRLVVGKEIDPNDLEKILLEAEVGKLMERMYGLFSVRQRSEKEVRDYLKNLSFKRKIKGQEEISALITSTIVEVISRKGLLNDKQFAQSWIEARSKKYGVNRVRQELYKKGIDREVIDELLNDSNHFNDGQQQTAKKLLEKKMRLWQGLPEMEFRKKATDYLMRRGFEYSLIKELVESFLKKE